MQAQGEHVLIRKPNKAKATESGLVLPDTMDQKLSYGRVVSAGDQVKEMGIKLNVGDIVAYHPQGVSDLELGSIADADMVIAHATHILLTLTVDDLHVRKLPIPA